MKITAGNDAGTYNVESRTRKGHSHTVDVEHLTCTCEGFMEFSMTSKSNPCAHLEAALGHHAELGRVTSNPEVQEALAGISAARITGSGIGRAMQRLRAEIRKATKRTVISESPFAWMRCKQQ